MKTDITPRVVTVTISKEELRQLVYNHLQGSGPVDFTREEMRVLVSGLVEPNALNGGLWRKGQEFP